VKGKYRDARERLTFEAGFLMNTIRSKKRPEKYYECGSWRIAGILYGLPAQSPELDRDLETGRIVLGGCVITDNDPARYIGGPAPPRKGWTKTTTSL
jgi:hypothetical protein